MSLLHPKTELGARQPSWENNPLVAALGLPPLPKIELPALPDLTGGCDPAKLTDVLGAAGAAALRDYAASSGVETALKAPYLASKAQLLGYLGTLTRQKDELLAQIGGYQTAMTALNAAQGVAGEIQGILGNATLQAVNAACPAAGGLLGYAGAAVGTAQGQLGGLQAQLSAAQIKLGGLSDLEGLVGEQLAAVEAHLGGVGGLLASVAGLP